MPKGAVDNRAISTPKGVNIDFTFDEDVSAIFRDRITSVVAESSVLDVRSNEQKAPGLRQWNVQSPLRQKKKGSIV
ncbi:condensin-2 complex subunit D3 [Trematomus bernacchii]|uniref:condensin-2 complex subunit D3 n=1 Tax=Trematomus bernacchii TaxID=40690 RepID=UPI00146AA3FB|nr:condensin-2 complex subunit D3 [Trematomus bernacchii]